jgi:hypothetical protein
MRARRWAVAIVGVVLHVARMAAADTEDSRVRAQRLFEEAEELTKHGRYAEACPKLIVSDALDRALGTEFNLADCYEHTARPASALALFQSVEAAARTTGRTVTADKALTRVRALTAAVSYLVVHEDASPPGLSMTLDGKSIVPGGEYPVDPGDHLVEATAPGFTQVHANVVVPTSHPGAIAVQLPALTPTAPAPQPAPAATGAPPDPAYERQPEGTPMLKAIAYGTGVVGLGGIGAAAFFGLRALSLKGDAKDCASSGACTTQDGVNALNGARSAANVATGLFAGGLALTGTAVVLLLVAPTRARVGLDLRPGFGPGRASIDVVGRF